MITSLRTRVIPVLLLRNGSLVKTVKFKKYSYVGDPCNTARIFNDLEVDELCVLDIKASIDKTSPNIELLKTLADECFMPLSYGGGIKTVSEARTIFNIGFEKIIINTEAFENNSLISELADVFGSQAIVVAIDVKRNFFGSPRAMSYSGKKNTGKDPLEWAKKVEELGAGEIIITSINNEGTWKGFDLELTKQISEGVSIPVIAHGGAGSVKDIHKVVNYAGLSAVALGSMVVFQKKDMGVLVNFPDEKTLRSGI